MVARGRRLIPASSWLLVIVAALALAQPGAAATVQQPAAPVPIHVAILPDQPLGETLNALKPATVANDRGFLLGTLGSDLWRARTDPPGEFWMVGDRGPNGQIRVDGVNRRTFPVPEWTPLIAHARIDADQIALLDIIPIRGASGAWVTGLANIPGFDETPYDYSAQVELPFNPSGLDTEGIVRTSQGDFWIVDEYSPSLVHVDPTGLVLARYVPIGLNLQGADYPVIEALPGIYLKRKINRGFEGIALSGDETTLYLALQSPLLNPDAATGNRSVQTRILAWDISDERPSAEYVYTLEDATAFVGTPTAPDEMKLSSIAWVNPITLIVDERTDLVAKVYSIDISRATNILGSSWDDPSATPALESLTDTAAAGVNTVPKTLILDLGNVSGIPEKIEGMAIVDAGTLAVANDNDSDIGDFDAQGNNVGTGAKSYLFYVPLDRELPL